MKNGLEMKYFVLKPRGTDLYAKASRKAMEVFADIIHDDNAELACDLRHWVGVEAAHAKRHAPKEAPGQ